MENQEIFIAVKYLVVNSIELVINYEPEYILLVVTLLSDHTKKEKQKQAY